MKALIYSIFLVLLGPAVWAGTIDNKTDKDYKKEIHKEYSIDSDGTVKLNNRYGDINIRTHNKNQVIIDVTISTDAPNESRAEELFDRINIDFSNSSDYVSAKTEIGDHGSRWWKSMWKGNNNIEFDIHYEVYVPSGVKLDIENRYGDVYLPDMDNDLSLELKYGDAQIGNLSGDLEFDISYGNASINDVEDIRIDIGYGDVDINSAKQIQMESKYSDIRIEEADYLDLESKYDDFRIGTIGTIKNEGKYDEFDIKHVDVFEIDTKYTDIEIRDLGKSGLFDTGYGSIDIDNALPSLENFDVEGRYTNISLTISNGFEIEFEGDYVKPRFRDSINYTKKDDDDNSVYIKGSHGSNPKAKLNFSMGYGSLKIDNR